MLHAVLVIKMGKLLLEDAGLSSKAALKKLFYVYTSDYCYKATEQDTLQAAEEGYIPRYWKINGAWRMMDEFQEVFGCKKGDRMAKPLTCKAHYFG